jgi:hypothetical protein
MSFGSYPVGYLIELSLAAAPDAYPALEVWVYLRDVEYLH